MELETENSQRSNGEGEDVEMENTNNAPIEIDTLLVYRQTGVPSAEDGPGVSSNITDLRFCEFQNRRGNASVLSGFSCL